MRNDGRGPIPRRDPVTTSTPRLMSLIRKRTRHLPRREPSDDVPDPLSFTALLRRLGTYKLTTYSPDKPRCIDAVAAARHGWVNSGDDDARERLWCETCKRGWKIEPPRVPGGWRSEAGNGHLFSCSDDAGEH
jgi:C3HC zinc finger-like